MESSEEQIRKFLYEVYGYRKIEELLRGEKPEDMKINEFFEGTLLSTSKTSYLDIETLEDRKIIFPRITKIRTTQECIDEHRVIKNKDLAFHTDNQSLFYYFNKENVGLYLKEKVLPIFPNCQIEYSQRIRVFWKYILSGNDFQIYIEGSFPRNNTRLLVVEFNESEKLKEDINSVVRNYYGFLRAKGIIKD